MGVARELCQKLRAKLRREDVVGRSRRAAAPSGREAIATIPEEDEPEEEAAEGPEDALRRELGAVERAAVRLVEGAVRETERLEKDRAVAEERLARVEHEFQVGHSA